MVAMSPRPSTFLPRIVVAGETGVGKSSLLNALLGRHAFEIGVVPTTRKNDECLWASDTGQIIVYDTPGFSEAEAKGNFLEHDVNVKNLIEAEAHVFLLVVSAVNRALQKQCEWITNARKADFFRNIPSLLIVNQIDKVQPVRDPWIPGELNLKSPRTEKEKNICEALEYIACLEAFAPFSKHNRILPVCAGEAHDSPDAYGIAEVKKHLKRLLAEAASVEEKRQSFMRRERFRQNLPFWDRFFLPLQRR